MDDYECEKDALRGFFERKSRMKDARERTRVFFVEPNLEWFRSNITFLQPFEMLTINNLFMRPTGAPWIVVEIYLM